MEKSNKQKRFVFVNLSVNSGFYGVNHGIAYLVPIIKKNSFAPVIINLLDDISEDEFQKMVKALEPSVVGFSFTSLQTKYLAKYSHAIDGLANCLKIAGGVGATLDPEGVLPGTSLDGLVVGEGEAPLNSLLKLINNSGDIYNAEGFYWKRDGKIEKKGVPVLVKELELQPFPDYSLFERDLVITGNMMNLNIMLSRGCPYSCTYCSNKALRSVYPSTEKYFRIPTVEYCIKLVEGLVKQYPEARFISFEDDLLIAKKEWFLNFAEQYRKRIGIPYRANVRTECINPDIVSALKDSGCSIGFLGLESGNEQLRKKLLNRHHSNELLVERALMVKRAGINLFTFNMVGLPFETKQNMKETLELNMKIKADFGLCTFFCPFPGTELYNTCKNEGLLQEDKFNDVATNYNTTPVIPKTEQAIRDCIVMNKRINSFLKWQELKYKHNEFRRRNPGPKTVLHLARLIIIYLLHRFSSPFAKNSLFSILANSKLQKRLSAMLK